MEEIIFGENEKLIWKGKPNKERMLTDCWNYKQNIIFAILSVGMLGLSIWVDRKINILFIIVLVLINLFPFLTILQNKKKVNRNFEYLNYILTNERMILQSFQDGLFEINLQDIHSVDIKFHKEKDRENKIGDIILNVFVGEKELLQTQEITLIDIENVDIIKEKIDETIKNTKEVNNNG